MRAGKLDRRVSIYSKSLTQDAYGEEIASETLLATVWAMLMEQRPGEVFSAGSDQRRDQVIFQIRKRSDVTEEMTAVYSGVRYEIKGIKEVGRNNRLNLICERQGESA